VSSRIDISREKRMNPLKRSAKIFKNKILLIKCQTLDITDTYDLWVSALICIDTGTEMLGIIFLYYSPFFRNEGHYKFSVPSGDLYIIYDL